SAAADLYYTDSYVVHRAMASYEFNDKLGLQFNINNVTDEKYFERIRNNATNGWATPGAARNAVLSLTWRLESRGVLLGSCERSRAPLRRSGLLRSAVS